MAEIRNYGTYNKKDLKAISQRATLDRPNQRTNSTKNLKDKFEKSTESIKQTKLADLEREARVARRSREERENERRKRNDELRMRNNDRRNRVEERKRLIFEAEREKQEAILRRNQETEARIEARRNKEKDEKKKKTTNRKSEKFNTSVAFGSSTPRMVCLNDTNGSFGSSFLAMAKEHDKKQATIIAGRRKFNEKYPINGPSKKSSSIYSQTINKPSEQVRKIQSPRNGVPMSKSIGVSSFKIIARLSCNSDGDTTPASSRSRSNSSMSRESTSTDSLDSCNVELRPRTIVTRRPMINNVISVPVKTNRLPCDAKVTSIEPFLPKVHRSPKIASTPNETKPRLTANMWLLKKQEEDQRLMEETMRLANEMLEKEKQRLKLAIEEDERMKREEKARRKREKEEAEKRAMEKAERQRIEFFERLKRSEEERLARRKRVETIMLRTRG